MDERTMEVVNRFSKSWNDTEKFIDSLIDNHHGFDKLVPFRQFISNLKQAGEDKYFRLGTFMHDLSFSRSVNDRLRDDQKYIKVEAIAIDDFEITLRDGKKIYRQYRVNNLTDKKMTDLLKTLKHTLVD